MSDIVILLGILAVAAFVISVICITTTNSTAATTTMTSGIVSESINQITLQSGSNVLTVIEPFIESAFYRLNISLSTSNVPVTETPSVRATLTMTTDTNDIVTLHDTLFVPVSPAVDNFVVTFPHFHVADYTHNSTRVTLTLHSDTDGVELRAWTLI